MLLSNKSSNAFCTLFTGLLPLADWWSYVPFTCQSFCSYGYRERDEWRKWNQLTNGKVLLYYNWHINTTTRLVFYYYPYLIHTTTYFMLELAENPVKDRRGIFALIKIFWNNAHFSPNCRNFVKLNQNNGFCNTRLLQKCKAFYLPRSRHLQIN